MFLNEGDQHWLEEKHPDLSVSGDVIGGTVSISAGYRPAENLFFSGENRANNHPDAVVLAGVFRIRIEKRRQRTTSRLPALYVDNIDPTPERHFVQDDKSACLCSPFEEDEFLEPDLRFKAFFEQLVVPFLYGQLYYSSHGQWPWREYAHGVTGLLEAYAKFGGQTRALECLQMLVGYRALWPDIKRALRQKPQMKGHLPCFCPKKDKIRRCHPVALAGMRRLQADISVLGIPVP